jgi:aspartokinase-like uncharacterized kinase
MVGERRGHTSFPNHKMKKKWFHLEAKEYPNIRLIAVIPIPMKRMKDSARHSEEVTLDNIASVVAQRIIPPIAIVDPIIIWIKARDAP